MSRPGGTPSLRACARSAALGGATPQMRTYVLSGARYRADHSIEGAEPIKLDAPYPVRIAPAAWI